MTTEEAATHIELYLHRAEIAHDITAQVYEDLKFHLDNLYRSIRSERETKGAPPQGSPKD